MEESTNEEWDELFWKATQHHAAAFRKQFKIAADACQIKYPVSCADRNTTLHYIGIAREDEIKLYNDMGGFITDVSNGKNLFLRTVQ